MCRDVLALQPSDGDVAADGSRFAPCLLSVDAEVLDDNANTVGSRRGDGSVDVTVFVPRPFAHAFSLPVNLEDAAAPGGPPIQRPQVTPAYSSTENGSERRPHLVGAGAHGIVVRLPHQHHHGHHSGKPPPSTASTSITTLPGQPAAPTPLLNRMPLVVKKISRCFSRSPTDALRYFRELSFALAIPELLIFAPGYDTPAAFAAAHAKAIHHRSEVEEAPSTAAEAAEALLTHLIPVMDAHIDGGRSTAAEREATAMRKTPSDPFPFASLSMVMPALQGDLRSLLRSTRQRLDQAGPSRERHRPFSPLFLEEVAFQLFWALATMHKAGVMHRDVKPDNLMYHRMSSRTAALASVAEGVATCDDDDDASRCRWFLGDYGLIRPLRCPSPAVVCLQAPPPSEGSAAPPMTDYVVTRWYRAPELLCGVPTYHGGVDVWAAACVIYETACVGTPLLPSQTESDAIVRLTRLLGPPSEGDLDALGVESLELPAGDGTCDAAAAAARPSWEDAMRTLAWWWLPRSGGAVDAATAAFAVQLESLLADSLTYDPEDRLTACGALAHPFMAPCWKRRLGDTSSTPSADDVWRMLPAVSGPSLDACHGARRIQGGSREWQDFFKSFLATAACGLSQT